MRELSGTKYFLPLSILNNVRAQWNKGTFYSVEQRYFLPYLNNARAQWNKGTFYRCILNNARAVEQWNKGTFYQWNVYLNNARAQWNKGTFYQRIPK